MALIEVQIEVIDTRVGSSKAAVRAVRDTPGLMAQSGISNAGWIDASAVGWQGLFRTRIGRNQNAHQSLRGGCVSRVRFQLNQKLRSQSGHI